MSISEKLQTIAENEQKVYDSGMTKGIEQGKKAEYDAFWDSYQDYGNRTDYRRAFNLKWWGDKNFYPKYDMFIKGAPNDGFAESTITNLKKRLEECGVILDFSGATAFSYVFNSSKITDIGVVNTTGAPSLGSLFNSAYSLKNIDALILKKDGSQAFSNDPFRMCQELENITIEGVIGQNGLNLQWSTKLSKASIESVINCLSTTTSGLSVTLSKAAVNKAFETSVGANNGATSTEWTTLIGTRSNWTISLV